MNDKLLIPVSILIAGALIGGGIYLKGNTVNSSEVAAKEAVKQAGNIRSVTNEDHILGNPNARVVVVEYSDPECPFCKDFHQTMRTIISNYGSNGEVAWIYRHYPIKELHSKGPKEAEALECAGELGGNAKFWEYTNRLYEITPSNDGLDPLALPEIAKQVGLVSADFNACLTSGKYAEKVAQDAENAKASGGEGTPYSIMIDTKTGDTYPLPGAQPYANLKSVIDLILQS